MHARQPVQTVVTVGIQWYRLHTAVPWRTFGGLCLAAAGLYLVSAKPSNTGSGSRPRHIQKGKD